MPTIRASDLIWIAVAVLLGVATAMMAPGVVVAQEGQHGVGHAQYHDVYRRWFQSNGWSSCCSGDDPATGEKGDCRPARAYKDPDDNLWRVLIGGEWRIVPPRAVRPYTPPDGLSHVCESPEHGIMCFVGGVPKS